MTVRVNKKVSDILTLRVFDVSEDKLNSRYKNWFTITLLLLNLFAIMAFWVYSFFAIVEILKCNCSPSTTMESLKKIAMIVSGLEFIGFIYYFLNEMKGAALNYLVYSTIFLVGTFII